MTGYTKLVKALRETDFGDTCVYCEYSDMCKADDCIILQAAAAIEELQADMKTYGKTAFDEGYAMGLAKGEEIADKRWQAEVAELKRVNMEIFEDLPKRGEWLTTKYHTWECSVCGKNPTTGMGYVQTRKALYNYCPNCGAKMREVQE